MWRWSARRMLTALLLAVTASGCGYNTLQSCGRENAPPPDAQRGQV